MDGRSKLNLRVISMTGTGNTARFLIWWTGLLALFNLGPVQARGQEFPYADHAWASLTPGLVGGGLVLWGRGLASGYGPIGLDELQRLRPEQVNALDRMAVDQWSPRWRRGSDWMLAALLAGTAVTVGVEGARAWNDGRGEDALSLAGMTVGVAALTVGLTTVTKALAGRIRPYAYNGSMSPEERFRVTSREGPDVFFSFFSGHASFAFAAATFSSTLVTDIHGSSTASNLMWGGTLGLAGLTAYARVRAGMHFPTDVLVGGVVGAAVGILLPRSFQKEEEDLAHALSSPLQFSLRVPFG